MSDNMEEINYVEQYPEHHRIFCEIANNVNNISELINQLGKLPKTGVPEIDLLYEGFYDAHMHLINMFISEDEE